ncbi:SusC/RagA family TonB-linked outer membrane protein [Bacteroides sp. AN502(2024)]|uniref:SusC/RagA family TonB-linked outer membrane protein n=1 Tax=Bacteroides sp. AN502(2024) TaxID=3160599 RepID=UPI0035182E84
MRKKYLYVLICFLVSTLATANAASRTITGVIISGEDNEPLIGASVYVHADDLKKAGSSQTSLGTITDMNGKFSLSVPEKVTRIHCSYIGFEEQVIVLQGDKRSYRIVLQPSAHALTDVVVTGYQTLERRKLTAAISKVELSDAMVGATKSIDQALTGQIAGVAVTNTSGAPGAPAKIRIRGTASLNGTQDPLWVLDGIPLEGTDIPKMDSNSSDNDIVNIGQSSIAGISPNDIESITILKDAAATAIYGARAANGVIVVTTKRGRTGKPVVNFNTKLTYSPNLDTSRLNLLNSEEKVNLELQMMKEQPFDYGGWGFMFYPVYPEKGGVANILRKYKLLDTYRQDGWDGLTPEAQNAINQLKSIHTDWNDILFRDAFTQEYNLSISGGNEKVTYYHSLGYTKENGNVPGVSLSRFNLTSKTNYQLNKLLKIGISIFANRRKNKTFMTDSYGLTNPVYYSRIANPYFEPFDNAHNYLYDYDVTGSVTDEKRGFNIFEERDNTGKESINTAINSIFDAELRFNDQWKLTSQIGVQWEQLSQEEYVGLNSFNMRNMREDNTYYKEGVRTYIIPEGGMLKTTGATTSQITWKTQGEYKNTFNNIHDIQIMAGSEIRKNWYESHVSTGYGYDPKTLNFRNLNFKDETQANENRWKLKNEIRRENAYASFFANGSYSLMNRYTLGGSIRMDGSDLFGVDKKYRFLPIYSVSGLWRLSNEPFMNQKWIDNLALRLSYGIQGNIDKNTSPFLVGSYKNTSILPGGTYEDYITIDSAPNSKLRWEKTTSYNIGVDFAVLNQAINLSVDYYYRKGTDLIGYKLLPLENGFESMAINWASMSNKGIEINLQTRNITTQNFSWYTSFNFAYNQNKVLKVMTQKNQVTPSLEGYPVGAIFVLKTKGINPDTGQVMLENKHGEAVTIEELFKMTPSGNNDGLYSIGVDTEEIRGFYSYAGTADAPYTGGLMNTFSYRNWELNLNVSYNIGAHVQTTPSYYIADLDPGINMNRDILDRWTPENVNGTFPALATYHTNPADYYLFSSRRDLYKSLDIWTKKLSYVRLQNIRLAYRLPSEWLQRVRISGATVGLEARNLFVFGSSYKNYMDPESMSNHYSTPVPKSVTFNLSLNF